MNNCQKNVHSFLELRFFFNERDSRLVEQKGSRTRSKQNRDTEFDWREGRTSVPPSIDFQTRLEISFARHRFRFPRIQITKAELLLLFALFAPATLGHFVELKMLLVFFPPPPLFFFSFSLDTGKFADRGNTRTSCCSKKWRGWKKNWIEGKNKIRLFDESFIPSLLVFLSFTFSINFDQKLWLQYD